MTTATAPPPQEAARAVLEDLVTLYGIAAQWRHKAGDRTGYTDHGGRAWHLFHLPAELARDMLQPPSSLVLAARAQELVAAYVAKHLPACGRRSRLAGAPPVTPNTWVQPGDRLALPPDVRPRRVCRGCREWALASLDGRCSSRRYDLGPSKHASQRYATTYGSLGQPRAKALRDQATRSWRCDGASGHDGRHEAKKARRWWH